MPDVPDEPIPADRRHRVWVIGLAVLLVALLATSAVLWQRQRDDDRSPAVLSSATTAVTTFFSLDHSTIEQDLDAMAALTTGDFAKAYGEQRDALAEQVTTKQLVVSATVLDDAVALEYVHEDDAQVLVAVDTTTTDEQGAASVDHYRMRVVLVRSDDAWKVSDLEQIG